MSNGSRNGKLCSLAMPDGSSYTGSWDWGSAHGNGTLITKTGTTHAGEFVHNFFKNEEGKVVHIQGDYQGDHDEHGIPHGKGVLKTTDGYSYSGGWKEGEKWGKGKEVMGNGDTY